MFQFFGKVCEFFALVAATIIGIPPIAAPRRNKCALCGVNAEPGTNLCDACFYYGGGDDR